jgi:aspartyl protease family protein
VLGIVDVPQWKLKGRPAWREVMKPAIFVPETFSALEALRAHLKAASDCLIILDEYGGLEGMVTQEELVDWLLYDAAPWQGDEAEVQIGAQRARLRLGGTPTLVGGAVPRPAAREIVVSASPGGHFLPSGAINGRAVRFMVDTGATLMALGRDEATRLGLDLSGARTGISQTANGPVPVQIVVLDRVRVGEVEITQVGAVVLPQPMPYVLLGNSFLTRFQMRRDNDVLRLELR